MDLEDAVAQAWRTGRVAVLITALIALPAAGCGVSVSVHGGVISGDGPYRAAWKQWWRRIQRDEKTYRATATSPGVCNMGGSKQACVATDEKVAGDLRGLRTALRSVHVPGPYRRATNLTLLAVSQDLRGLNLRIRSLSAAPRRSRNATHGSDSRTSSCGLPGARSQEAGPHFRTGPGLDRPRKPDIAQVPMPRADIPERWPTPRMAPSCLGLGQRAPPQPKWPSRNRRRGAEPAPEPRLPLRGGPVAQWIEQRFSQPQL